MEEYTEKELQRIKLQILNREISICKTCDTFFDYVPQKQFCNECIKERRDSWMSNRGEEILMLERKKQQIRDKKRQTKRKIRRILR